MERYGLGMYAAARGPRLGVVTGDRVVDLEEGCAAAGIPVPAWVRGDLGALIARWDEVSADVDATVGKALAASAPGGAGLDRLVAPFLPSRIFAAAANYVEHANEMGTVLAAKANSKPYIFMKADSAVVGPGEAVVMPPESQQVDWEVELAAVIGRTCRRVGTAEALDYVAGYTILNDVSARDLNVRSDFPFKFDWFQGKSFDTFAPLGPCFVPRRWIDDPQKLRLRLSVNGEVMQDATTSEMIFTVAEQVSYLSSILTLRPGDVVATGTPTGVGMARGVFLKDGDVMEAWVEGVGTLRNPVQAHAAAVRSSGARSPEPAVAGE